MSNITREQNKNLITTVATLVNVLKKNEDVECIYLMPLKADEENIYKLVIVYGSYRMALHKCENVIPAYRKWIEKNVDSESIGGELQLKVDHSGKYLKCAVNPSDVRRVDDILSSRILYTKKGYGIKYHKVAHQFDRYHTTERYPEYFRIAIPEEQKKKMKKIERSKNV